MWAVLVYHTENTELIFHAFKRHIEKFVCVFSKAENLHMEKEALLMSNTSIYVFCQLFAISSEKKKLVFILFRSTNKQ